MVIRRKGEPPAPKMIRTDEKGYVLAGNMKPGVHCKVDAAPGRTAKACISYTSLYRNHDGGDKKHA